MIDHIASVLGIIVQHLHTNQLSDATICETGVTLNLVIGIFLNKTFTMHHTQLDEPNLARLS